MLTSDAHLKIFYFYLHFLYFPIVRVFNNWEAISIYVMLMRQSASWAFENIVSIILIEFWENITANLEFLVNATDFVRAYKEIGYRQKNIAKSIGDLKINLNPVLWRDANAITPLGCGFCYCVIWWPTFFALI